MKLFILAIVLATVSSQVYCGSIIDDYIKYRFGFKNQAQHEEIVVNYCIYWTGIVRIIAEVDMTVDMKDLIHRIGRIESI
jgi:hypothetical protein